MKIVFFGTPEFAIPSLKAIYQSDNQLLAVVTAPDKQQGRGKKVSVSPVKNFAIVNNIPLFQPETLKNNDSLMFQLKQLNPDLFVVVAFRILPKEIFEIPQYGSFNLHASLLPKYRGAAPIQWALINGETLTGLTTFKLSEKVDTGNIYLQKEVQISPEDNFGTLHDRLSEVGADLVMKTIDLIESKKYQLIPQNDLLASPAPKITKEIRRIDWNKSAQEIHNLIRALSPEPGAFFVFKKKIIKLFKTEIVALNLKPLQIIQNKNELIIGCATDALKILEIQLEGKKRMSIQDFLRGFSFV